MVLLGYCFHCLTTLPGLPSLDLLAKYQRLKSTDRWAYKTNWHTTIINDQRNLKAKLDYLIPKSIFAQSFEVRIPERDEWKEDSVLEA